MICTLTSPRVLANSPTSEETSVVVMVWVSSHMPVHSSWRCSSTICMTWMWYTVWKVLQSPPWCISIICTLTLPTISAKSPKLGGLFVLVMLWVCIIMIILHKNKRRCSNTFYVWHGCGMQFERFYNLNHSVVAWFAHLQLHHLWSQPSFPNLGRLL
jgi:hypothetical protein